VKSLDSPRVADRRFGNPGGHEEHQAGPLRVRTRCRARYVFLVNGAKLEGYRSIIGGGVTNIFNMHYYRNTGELKSGDMVLMDYAPDYGCYVSDITRMWPVNGKFELWQRELLQFVLEWRNAILKRIRTGCHRGCHPGGGQGGDGVGICQNQVFQTHL